MDDWGVIIAALMVVASFGGVVMTISAQARREHVIFMRATVEELSGKFGFLHRTTLDILHTHRDVRLDRDKPRLNQEEYDAAKGLYLGEAEERTEIRMLVAIYFPDLAGAYNAYVDYYNPLRDWDYDLVKKHDEKPETYDPSNEKEAFERFYRSLHNHATYFQSQLNQIGQEWAHPNKMAPWPVSWWAAIPSQTKIIAFIWVSASCLIALLALVAIRS